MQRLEAGEYINGEGKARTMSCEPIEKWKVIWGQKTVFELQATLIYVLRGR